MKENDNTATISISKKGGHIIFANYNKTVSTEIISQEKANEIAKDFLDKHGYTNMKETYYLKHLKVHLYTIFQHLYIQRHHN